MSIFVNKLDLRRAPAPFPVGTDASVAAAGLGRWLGALRRRAEDRVPQAAAGTAPAPPGADWAWRPSVWQQAVDLPAPDRLESGVRLGTDGLALFHDCPDGDIALRQVCHDARAPTGFGLQVAVGAFDGSFLSMALDLPPGALAGLCDRRIFGVTVDGGAERSVKTYVRLNIRHGPNTERMVREIPAGDGPTTVEFGLAAVAFDPKRVSALWADVIFDRPAQTWVALRDLTLYRRWRAEI